MPANRRLLFSIAFLVVLSSGPVDAQHVTDAKAMGIAARSLALLTRGTPISDVTLTGAVTWIAGSDKESGTATLWAAGARESRVDLALTRGTRTEIRDAQTGMTRGAWTAPSGAGGKFAFHNCQTDAVWFFPALSSLAPSTNLVLSYIGHEDRKGKSVEHIHSYVRQSEPRLAQWVRELSAMEFYVDAATLLPSAITFNVHPDNNALGNIPIEVDFSDYQSINGVLVPMHIEKYVQGTLMIDLTISNAVFNTGVPLSNFATN